MSGLHEFAANPLAIYGFTAELRDYRRMILTRATPTVITLGGNPTAPTPCQGPIVFSSGVGSGTLSSSSRVTTAFHVVASYDGMMNKHEAHILFESGDQNALQKRTDAALMMESPLLAKRLFGLGLDDWASANTAAMATRQALRSWDITWDEVGGAQPFVQQAAGTSYEGRDLAVMRVSDNHTTLHNHTTWHDTKSNDYLSSGSFDNILPAPFFDRAYVTPFEPDGDEVCPFDSNDELYGLYTNLYDFNAAANSSGSTFYPLSGSGYTDMAGAQNSHCANLVSQCVRDPSSSPPVQLRDVSFQGCIKTTIDARPGCSGGGLYARTCAFDYEDGQYSWNDPVEEDLVFRGVVNGVTIARANNPDNVWGDQHLPNFGTEAGQTSLSHNSSWTVLDSGEASWTRRDLSFDPVAPDPFNPVPAQPDADGCPGDRMGNNCFITIKASTSQGYSPPPVPSDPIRIERDSSGSSPDDEWDEVEGYADGPLAEAGLSLMSCFDEKSPDSETTLAEQGWSLPWGMMQGVLGSTSVLDQDAQEAEIDAIRPICVPWSSETWLKNWSWTQVAPSVGSLDDVSNYTSAQFLLGIQPKTFIRVYRKLWYVLANAYEVRETVNTDNDSVAVLHPPSFKTCPPNYYLKGLRYLKTSDKVDDGIVAGITHLICRTHKTAWERLGSQGSYQKEIEVPLAHTLAQGQNAFQMDYPALGEQADYDLSARIGLNQAPNSQYHSTTDMCERSGNTEWGVGAMTIKRGNNGLEYLHLLCQPVPRGGVQ